MRSAAYVLELPHAEWTHTRRGGRLFFAMRERRRRRAVVLMDQGESPTVIARILGVARGSLAEHPE